jgi:hypothetical protein
VIPNFTEIRPVGTTLIQADSNDESIRDAKAPKKEQEHDLRDRNECCSNLQEINANHREVTILEAITNSMEQSPS